MRLRALAVLLFLLVLQAAVPAGAHPKVDSVLLDNGDRVTCEIKQLTSGKLTVKTDAMSTVDIEWKHVRGLYSRFYFRVETQTKQRYFGSLEWRQGEQILAVLRASDSVYVPAQSVVEIQPIEKSFWSRFDGSLSLGFSYTKASHISQLSANSATTYRTERNRLDLKFSTIITRNSGQDSLTRRLDLTLGYTRLLGAKGWSAATNASLQRNDELKLKQRLQLGLSGGYSPLKSNLNVLTFSLGAAVNSELSTDSTSTTESAEAVIAGKYALFKYDSPKADLNTSLYFYPSLTQEGRYRLEYDIKARFELVKDFFIDLSFYTSYDSKPASGGAAVSDYGVVTSLSWSY